MPLTALFLALPPLLDAAMFTRISISGCFDITRARLRRATATRATIIFAGRLADTFRYVIERFIFHIIISPSYAFLFTLRLMSL